VNQVEGAKPQEPPLTQPSSLSGEREFKGPRIMKGFPRTRLGKLWQNLFFVFQNAMKDPELVENKRFFGVLRIDQK
jgi:hypothetical protein